MVDKFEHARNLCLDQAQGFIEAAERLDKARLPHIIYHLSLLALEEVGKASMLSARMIAHSDLDSSWIDRSLESHRRKLQWAVWSPMRRIDPADFEAARKFAEDAHAKRLRSLYVDADADMTDPPPREQVDPDEAVRTLALAAARLRLEQAHGVPTGEPDELFEWFLDTMADPERARVLLSKPSIAQYEAFGADARKWIAWAKEESAQFEQKMGQLLEQERARPGAAPGNAKPKWRSNATVYTPSHSLRSKVLARWNEQIRDVQLIWTGKKDELTLQVTLHDNMPLNSLFGRLSSLSKLVVACLNIGTIGYFWFERPGFEQNFFKEVRDLEHGQPMAVEKRDSFWGDGRAVALTDLHIEHAMHCMMAFAPLTDDEAAPIFAPYCHGLALIAKSDIFYNFDTLARHSFVRSLAGALMRYGGWTGKAEEFEAAFHRAYEPMFPEAENREKMLKALKIEGDPDETPLANLRTAKQVVDLYLIYTGRRTWQTILDRFPTGPDLGPGKNPKQ